MTGQVVTSPSVTDCCVVSNCISFVVPKNAVSCNLSNKENTFSLSLSVSINLFLSSAFSVRMAGVNGDRKGKKDDNGIGTAIDFMLSNAKLVLGVGGAAMLGIATLAVKRVGSHLPTFLYTSPLPCTVLLL